MEFNEALKSRRSIRKYDGSKKVTRKDMESLIEAGLLAPSWKNFETARYYVALSDDAIKAVRDALPEFNYNNTGGAAFIAVSFVPDRSGTGLKGEPATELCHNEWGAYDLGLSTENMLLKATELGLGTLIMGLSDREKIKEIFAIPENEILMSVIAVGYPDINPEMPRRKKIEDVAKFI